MSRYLDPKVPKELTAIPEIAQAIELSEEAAYTPAELEGYLKYWDAISREKTLLNASHAKGKAEGRIEEKQEIAQKMLQQGMKAEDIAQLTGLTKAEIESLRPKS